MAVGDIVFDLEGVAVGGGKVAMPNVVSFDVVTLRHLHLLTHIHHPNHYHNQQAEIVIEYKNIV